MRIHPDNRATLREVQVIHTLGGVRVSKTYDDDWFDSYFLPVNVADDGAS